jgi:hypothetical protein
MRRLLIALVALTLVLPSCGASPLLADVSLSAPVLQPSAGGATVTIAYRVGRDAQVSIYLEDAAGTHYTLREDEPRRASPDPYTLRFDGTAPTDDPVLKRRLLASGTYNVVVEARTGDGSTARASQPLTLQSSDAPLPDIADLVVAPQVISPNADAINDVAEITYRLPVTATVDISVTSPDGGEVFPLVTDEEQEPILHRQVWNGRAPDGRVLADGVYTYTIRAVDAYGSTVERQLPIEVRGSGQPEVTITYSYMAPQALMLGEVLTITLRVKNTGLVPIRTYGPPSGYQYSTQDVFSSVEDSRYAAKSGGFWRIGADWDANSGGAAKRYPYRWAISPRPPEQWKVPFVEDVLAPGEEATITGRIKVEQQETKMGFYVGLIQDGVGFFQDRTGRTIIEVGF